MKRVFMFAVLAGLSASPWLAARADDLAAPGGVQPEPQSPNVVTPEAPRGQLGGLASGAPGFAANVQQLRGQAGGQPIGPSGPAAQAAPAAAPGAAAGVATGATVVEKQTVTPAQSHRTVRMMIHHCVRAHLISKGVHPAFLPVHIGGPILHFTPPGAPSIGDLELIGVGVVADAIDDKGPIYRVTFRNNSRIPSHHFRVSLIALHGELCDASPVMTMLIDELAAGATGHVDVQLPHSVMSMGPKDGPAPFETLVAVVDSFDELIEDSELNNVATFTRGEIAVIETTETAVAQPAAPAQGPAVAPGAAVAPAQGGPAPGGPAPGGPAPGGAPQGVAPAAPAQAPPGGQPAPGAQAPAPAPQDSSILDQLDIDNMASGTSQLFSR